MKSILDEIGKWYLFIDGVAYRDRQLTITLARGAPAKSVEDVVWGTTTLKDCRETIVEEGAPRYMVHFEVVLLYMAYDEGLHRWENDEIETEGVITKFADSSLLRYVREHTHLFEFSQAEIEHYCINTADDSIHVFTVGKPVVVSDNA
jgi:hypothetical protein